MFVYVKSTICYQYPVLVGSCTMVIFFFFFLLQLPVLCPLFYRNYGYEISLNSDHDMIRLRQPVPAFFLI